MLHYPQQVHKLLTGTQKSWGYKSIQLLLWMCRIDFLFRFSFKKTRIRFGMNLVRLKNAVRFGYYSYLLLML